MKVLMIGMQLRRFKKFEAMRNEQTSPTRLRPILKPIHAWRVQAVCHKSPTQKLGRDPAISLDLGRTALLLTTVECQWLLAQYFAALPTLQHYRLAISISRYVDVPKLLHYEFVMTA